MVQGFYWWLLMLNVKYIYSNSIFLQPKQQGNSKHTYVVGKIQMSLSKLTILKKTSTAPKNTVANAFLLANNMYFWTAIDSRIRCTNPNDIVTYLSTWGTSLVALDAHSENWEIWYNSKSKLNLLASLVTYVDISWINMLQIKWFDRRNDRQKGIFDTQRPLFDFCA